MTGRLWPGNRLARGPSVGIAEANAERITGNPLQHRALPGPAEGSWFRGFPEPLSPWDEKSHAGTSGLGRDRPGDLLPSPSDGSEARPRTGSSPAFPDRTAASGHPVHPLLDRGLGDGPETLGEGPPDFCLSRIGADGRPMGRFLGMARLPQTPALILCRGNIRDYFLLFCPTGFRLHWLKRPVKMVPFIFPVFPRLRTGRKTSMRRDLWQTTRTKILS